MEQYALRVCTAGGSAYYLAPAGTSKPQIINNNRNFYLCVVIQSQKPNPDTKSYKIPVVSADSKLNSDTALM